MTLVVFSVADTYYGDCTCCGALIMDPVCIKSTLDIITNWQRIPDEAHVFNNSIIYCIEAHSKKNGVSTLCGRGCYGALSCENCDQRSCKILVSHVNFQKILLNTQQFTQISGHSSSSHRIWCIKSMHVSMF